MCNATEVRIEPLNETLANRFRLFISSSLTLLRRDASGWSYDMTALIAKIEKAAAWLAGRRTESADAERRTVGGLWEMLSPNEREAAFNFEGDDTIGRR
jgi:hypothetical protein